MGGKTAGGSAFRITKVLLFSLNVFFLLGGGALLGLGVWIRVDGDDYFHVLAKGGPEIPADIMIAVGAAAILISILGCLGALIQNRCLLLSFIGVLCVIVATQILLVSLSIRYKDEIKEKVTERVTDNFQMKYAESGQKDLTASIDKIQEELECCGASNYSDWNTSKFGRKNPTFYLPLSCCRTASSTNCRRGLDTAQIYTQNCINELEDWANTRFIIIISLGIAVAIFEILGICFALLVLRYI